MFNAVSLLSGERTPIVAGVSQAEAHAVCVEFVKAHTPSGEMWLYHERQYKHTRGLQPDVVVCEVEEICEPS